MPAEPPPGTRVPSKKLWMVLIILEVNFPCVCFQSYEHSQCTMGRQPKLNLEISTGFCLAEYFIIPPMSAISREYLISHLHIPVWIFSWCHGN